MAKTGTFNLWLVDQGTRSQYYWGEGTMYAIGVYLTEYFNQICQHKNSPFSSAGFSWSGGQGQVRDNELVCYFLPSLHSSIIKSNGGAPKHWGSGGTYPTSSGIISEVYLDMMEGDRDYPRLVANIAFHELLHNKLDTAEPHSVNDIHSLTGGLSVPTVVRGMRPSNKEIGLMASALSKESKQYTLSM